MSFAYIQGREEEALSYFEKRLQISRDQEEIDRLKQIISELRNKLVMENKSVQVFSSQSLSLKCA